ncbi:MAG: ArnT family glycosyltransferase [Kiritimatiellia bacterium]
MKQRLIRFGVSLGALLAVRLFVMWNTPVFDPSEARYAAISANMARTGEFLVPHFTHKGVYRSFDGKPPLVFQAGGVFCRLLGVNEFAVRLFPLLSALLLLAILFHAVRRLKDTRTACLAVGICATSVAFYATAGFCLTDLPLTCCVSGALLLHACRRVSHDWRDTLGIAALLGCGMLVKGPVALVLFALPVGLDACLNRRWRDLLAADGLWGAVLFLAIAAPWFALMQERNPGFLRYFFIHENLLRFLVHDYGDKYGAGRETFRGMAAVWLVVVTLPWSLVPLAGFFRRPRIAFALPRDFPSLAVLAITLFWCLTSRVPLTYLLPAVPLFAAGLALKTKARARLWRLLPPVAALNAAILCGTILCARTFTQNMMGAAAPKRSDDRHYSHEFYHGPWGEGSPAVQPRQEEQP